MSNCQTLKSYLLSFSLIRNKPDLFSLPQSYHSYTEPRRSAEAHKAIPKVGSKTKNDYLRGRLLNEPFKVIIEDTTAQPYLRELYNTITLTRKIGVFYNQTVKTLSSYHTFTTAQRMIRRLGVYSEALFKLQIQAILLTIAFETKEATK